MKSVNISILFTFVFIISNALNGFAVKKTSAFKLTRNKLYNAEIQDATSKAINVKDLVKPNKLTLIAFFGEYCVPCMDELDSMNGRLKQINTSLNTNMFAVALTKAENKDKVNRIAQGHGWQFPILYDFGQDAKMTYRITSLPYLIIINEEGKVVYENIGWNKQKMSGIIDVLTELQPDVQ